MVLDETCVFPQGREAVSCVISDSFFFYNDFVIEEEFVTLLL